MRAGIMVKDGSALERLAPVDRALLDKTGTLTLGRPLPDPAALASLDGRDAQVALALASHSRHPLARALANALARRGVSPAEVENVRKKPGEGVFADWRGLHVALRRPDGASGGIAASLHIEGEPARLIPFSDRLRPDAKAALAQLSRLGIECSILSGDRPEAVAEIARQTGLTAQGNARPQDKQALVGTLRASGRKVLVVGDGLNDGPALAAADASMAPGSASDVGLQAADLVFVQDSLLALPRAVRGARRTMAVVRQNFALAIGYNMLAVPLAIAGLVTPMVAAIAMSTSSLIVVGNSLRLARAAR
jgi:Cu2+-exporting ATPase